MGSRFERFSEGARRVLSLAQEEAQRFNHNYIGTEHILLGLVRGTEGLAARVLASLGVDLNRVRSAVESIIGRGDRPVRGGIGLTPRAKKVVELAVDEVRRMNHTEIGTEHLLIGLLREGEGVAAGVLETLGVTLDKVRTETHRIRQAGAEELSAMGSDLGQVKRQVAVANRILAEVGLATGVLASLGHASLRVPSEPDKFVVKGRGYSVDALAKMRPEDMVVCDLEGNYIAGPPGTSQCYEVKMHSCIYKTHPEVQSVVHVHPRYVVVMSVLGVTLVPMCMEGIQLVRHPLPIYPHVKTIQSDEEGMEVARLLGNSKAIILQGHGAATVGATLNESVVNMLQLEEQAKMNWYAYCAAGPSHPRIPDHLIDEITNRPQVTELSHFQEVLRGRGAGSPGTEGVWNYYADLVSRDL